MASLFAFAGQEPSGPGTTEEVEGPALLYRLPEASGGCTFVPNGFDSLTNIAEKISAALRNRYVRACLPPKKSAGGKWQEIRIKVLSPKGLAHLTV